MKKAKVTGAFELTPVQERKWTATWSLGIGQLATVDARALSSKSERM